MIGTFTLNLISGHRFIELPLTRHLPSPYETGDHRAPSKVLEEPTPTSKCESHINSCGSVQGEEIFTSLPSPTKSIDESRTMGSTDGLLEDYFCKWEGIAYRSSKRPLTDFPSFPLSSIALPTPLKKKVHRQVS